MRHQQKSSQTLNRRKFVASMGMLAAALPLGARAFDFALENGSDFNFMLLGDLHFDKLEHHDMEYVKTRFSNDISQINNYSRITHENLPLLMKVIKQKAQMRRADFYLQLGDFVEGLCGSELLARKQVTEFIDCIGKAELNRPFLVIKGNHDITGEGAAESYNNTVLPWQSRELEQKEAAANTTFVHRNARFILFDAYTPDTSLEWLKLVLKEHKEQLLFFCIHMPVVPFNARSNWHIFAKPSQQRQREELLNLLGAHRAIVLCGHLHKTCVLVRNTPKGNFVQACIGSVIPSPDAPIKDHVSGLAAYGSALTTLEPSFSVSTLTERKENLENEKPLIRYFEYADFCGYATVSVTGSAEVELSVYANVNEQPWKIFTLTKLVNN